jgi:hypothetical protein
VVAGPSEFQRQPGISGRCASHVTALTLIAAVMKATVAVTTHTRCRAMNFRP